MQCPKCGYEPTLAEIQSSPDQCPGCGVYYAKVRQASVLQGPEAVEPRGRISSAWLGAKVSVEEGRLRRAEQEAEVALRHSTEKANGVVVVDIKMGFWSMVVFMVKWVIAAIPALIILAFIFAIFMTLASAVPAYFRYKDIANSMEGAVVQPERIPVLVPADGEFFAVAKAVRGSIAVQTVKTVFHSGEVAYARLTVDCARATGYISASGNTLDELGGRQAEANYESIKAGTPRQYIAKHACKGADRVHAFLQ